VGTESESEELIVEGPDLNIQYVVYFAIDHLNKVLQDHIWNARYVDGVKGLRVEVEKPCGSEDDLSVIEIRGPS